LLSSQHAIQLMHRRQLQIYHPILSFLNRERRNTNFLIILTSTRLLSIQFEVSLVVRARNPEFVILVADEAIAEHERSLVRTHLLRSKPFPTHAEDSKLSVAALDVC